MGSVGGLALLLNSQTGFPFGRSHPVERIGSAGIAACHAGWVLVMVVGLFSARGVAKLLLLPRRNHRWYGYGLLALNAALGTIPLIGLDLLGTRVTGWWRWESQTWQWQGIALPHLTGCLLVSAVALLLATPALVGKHPVPVLPGPGSLRLWFALNLALLLGLVSRAPDAAVALLAAVVAAATTLAFQRSRSSVMDCRGLAGQE